MKVGTLALRVVALRDQVMWQKGYDGKIHHELGDGLKGCSAPVNREYRPEE